MWRSSVVRSMSPRGARATTLRSVRRLLARALGNARRDGSLSRDLRVPACADHLLGTAAGAFLLARSGWRSTSSSGSSIPRYKD